MQISLLALRPFSLWSFHCGEAKLHTVNYLLKKPRETGTAVTVVIIRFMYDAFHNEVQSGAILLQIQLRIYVPEIIKLQCDLTHIFVCQCTNVKDPCCIFPWHDITGAHGISEWSELKMINIQYVYITVGLESPWIFIQSYSLSKCNWEVLLRCCK